MRVLIVKTSSMGDLIHTLPAVTDAIKALPQIRFDWVAEEGFAEIPTWHSSVDKVIPVAMRRWRKNIVSAIKNKEISAAVQLVRATEYDYVIDAQGLIKSAIIARLSRGVRCGTDRKSSRESFASMAYQKKIVIPPYNRLHAIERLRLLFSKILGYSYDAESLDYGLNIKGLTLGIDQNRYLVFLHGTSRNEKLWQEHFWIDLAKQAVQAGYKVYLPWGNVAEKQRAENLASGNDGCTVLPKMNLHEIACLLNQASAVIGVDTGLAHLTAALATPAVTIYTATDPVLFGACGTNNTCLAETKTKSKKSAIPVSKIEYCKELSVKTVWDALQKQVGQNFPV